MPAREVSSKKSKWNVDWSRRCNCALSATAHRVSSDWPSIKLLERTRFPSMLLLLFFIIIIMFLAVGRDTNAGRNGGEHKREETNDYGQRSKPLPTRQRRCQWRRSVSPASIVLSSRADFFSFLRCTGHRNNNNNNNNERSEIAFNFFSFFSANWTRISWRYGTFRWPALRSSSQQIRFDRST